ncbi:MAG: TolC family protein, partial [bacterium]|nr:TolC family protein [bacterium]
ALEVSHAFFDAVAAEQQVEVRTTALEAADSQLQVARRRFEVGEVTSADVARWRAQRAAELQDLVLIQGRTELARRRLARLAGIERLGTLEILDPIPVPEGSESFAELTAAALEKRREFEVLSRRRAAAELMVRIERGARLPELDAHFQYYVQKAEFPSEDWVSLSLALTVPIYDGGVAAARTAKAREDLTQLDLLIREMDKAIRDQVDVAVISYRTATAALEAARERRTAAREAQHQTERAYRVGEATATALLDAATELADAATAEVIARWQRELQAIALRHAVGEPPVPGVELHETKEGQSP